MWQGREHPLLHRLVAGLAAVRVHPHHPVRDPPEPGHLVAEERRVAHRVVWVNPHRGKAGYEPVQQGVLAALPHCDDFVAGHSLATYADLVEVLADA